MFAIRSSQKSDACTAHILPCRIHHNGPTKVTKRYWNVSTEKDGSKVAYFRGRKLKGTSLRLPQQYQGLVVKSTEQILPATQNEHFTAEDDSDQDEDEPQAQVKVVESVSDITEIIVWDHDQPPASDDVFRKGVDEFIAFTDAIHS